MHTSLVLRQVAQPPPVRIFLSIQLMNTRRVVVMFLLGSLTSVKPRGVNYWKLFHKLLYDSVNVSVVRILAYWYSNQHV